MFKFCNHYPTELWVCLLWYHPNCSDGGDWEKKGWWHLNPGECKIAFSGDLDEVNRYWYYYAEAADGAYWAGPYGTNVSNDRFDWCINTGSSNSRNVGFRELDIGDNDDVTLNLTS